MAHVRFEISLSQSRLQHRTRRLLAQAVTTSQTLRDERPMLSRERLAVHSAVARWTQLAVVRAIPCVRLGMLEKRVVRSCFHTAFFAAPGVRMVITQIGVNRSYFAAPSHATV